MGIMHTFFIYPYTSPFKSGTFLLEKIVVLFLGQWMRKMNDRKKRSQYHVALIVLIVGIMFSSSHVFAETIDIKNVSELDAYFSEKKYSVQKWIDGTQKVPPLVILDIPISWREKVSPSLPVAEKKKIFFRVAIPLAFVGNNLVTRDREKLIRLSGLYHQGTLGEHDRDWLKRKASDYKLASVEIDGNMFKALVEQIDIIPPSLMVAQMADESGWGTSRFASEGNALFGQWSYKGGIHPKGHQKGKGDYSIKAFKTPLDSIQAYILNLNSNRAYSEFRKQRSALRAEGKTLSGPVLVGTLINYSQRREAYVKDLENMMEYNNLIPLDKAKLATGETVYIRLGETEN
jgi:Bax protein